MSEYDEDPVEFGLQIVLSDEPTAFTIHTSTDVPYAIVIEMAVIEGETHPTLRISTDAFNLMDLEEYQAMATILHSVAHVLASPASIAAHRDRLSAMLEGKVTS